MKLSRTTPTQHFEIRVPRWKERAVGLAKHRIGTHNKIDILALNKDKKRNYPDTYYISGQDIRLGLFSGRYEIQNVKGLDLVIVPIKDLELLEVE